MKVAVIGTGVIGAAVGWHLARRGADVLLLDRGEPGRGVTDWTFSWVNASNKTQTREYFDLSATGLSAHYRLGRKSAPTAGGTRSGTCAGRIPVRRLTRCGPELPSWRRGATTPSCGRPSKSVGSSSLPPASPPTTPRWPSTGAKAGSTAAR